MSRVQSPNQLGLAAVLRLQGNLSMSNVWAEKAVNKIHCGSVSLPAAPKWYRFTSVMGMERDMVAFQNRPQGNCGNCTEKQECLRKMRVILVIQIDSQIAQATPAPLGELGDEFRSPCGLVRLGLDLALSCSGINLRYHKSSGMNFGTWG